MLILCVVLILLQPTTGAGESPGDGHLDYALKFEDNPSSYIIFQPDMSPFRTSFSLCAWVRKLRPDGEHPSWFSYSASGASSNEILISDNGEYNHIFGSGFVLTSRFTVSPGTWYHHCKTWSTATQVQKIYLNGELVGSKGTPSGRTLGMNGYVVIGNDQNGYGIGMAAQYSFGGELYQLNIYSKELTASEVHEMAAGGLCSGIERQYGETRHLKWETILQQERGGNISLIEPGCQVQPTDSSMPSSTPYSTDSGLLQTRLDEMENELNRTKVELEQTRIDLAGTIDRLNKTEDKLEEAIRQLKDATTDHWNVLYSEPFLNNVFTHDLFMKLRSSWDMLEVFVGSGVKLTEDVIEHFKSYQELILSVSEGCDTDDGT